MRHIDLYNVAWLVKHVFSSDRPALGFRERFEGGDVGSWLAFPETVVRNARDKVGKVYGAGEGNRSV